MYVCMLSLQKEIKSNTLAAIVLPTLKSPAQIQTYSVSSPQTERENGTGGNVLSLSSITLDRSVAIHFIDNRATSFLKSVCRVFHPSGY